MLSFLIVGFGKMGKLHQSKIMQLRKNATIYLYDKNIDEEFCLDNNRRINVKNLSNIDCVIIATSTNSHFDSIKKFAHLTKIFFVEKPFGYSFSERLELLEKYKYHIFLVNNVERFGDLPDVTLKILNKIDSIKKIKINRHSYQRSVSPWYFDLAYHDLDILAYLGFNLKYISSYQDIQSNFQNGKIILELVNPTSNILVEMNYKCFNDSKEFEKYPGKRNYEFFNTDIKVAEVNFDTGLLEIELSDSEINFSLNNNDKLLSIWSSVIEAMESGERFDKDRFNINKKVFEIIECVLNEKA